MEAFIQLLCERTWGLSDPPSLPCDARNPYCAARGADSVVVKGWVAEVDQSKRGLLALVAAVPMLHPAACSATPRGRGGRRDLVSVTDYGARGDGVADDTAAIQAALNSGAARVHVPAGLYRVTSTLAVPDDLVVEGTSRTRAQIFLAEEASQGVDVLHVGQHVTIRDLWIRGNWDRTSQSEAGSGIVARDRKAGYLHGLTLQSIQVDRCRQHGIHVEDGAYGRMWNIDCNTHGADALFLEGTSTASLTTFEISGSSVFSSCFGYGVRLKNCASSRLSFISEYTKGVAIEGDNRALSFDSCYFETPLSKVNHLFNFLNGGTIGLSIRDCYLGMVLEESVLQSDPNVRSLVMQNNVNLSGRPYGAPDMMKRMVLS